jgi:hypothetical protein
VAVSVIQGKFSGRQVSNALRELARAMGHTLRLEPAVWQSLMAAVDVDEDGVVNWTDLTSFLCDVFRHIERERLLHTQDTSHAHAPALVESLGSYSNANRPSGMETSPLEGAASDVLAQSGGGRSTRGHKRHVGGDFRVSFKDEKSLADGRDGGSPGCEDGCEET